MIKKKPRWPWPDHVTADEALEIEAADKAQAAAQRLNKKKAQIISRATHRAKYAAQKKEDAKACLK